MIQTNIVYILLISKQNVLMKSMLVQIRHHCLIIIRMMKKENANKIFVKHKIVIIFIMKPLILIDANYNAVEFGI